MDVDWFNTCEEQPERMRNFAKELRLALFPQVSARKFRNWSTEAQREVDSCLLLAHRVISLLRGNSVASGVKRTSIKEPGGPFRVLPDAYPA
jgi:hypothetical protein